MLKFLILFLGIALVFSDDITQWIDDAKFDNYVDFYHELMQDSVAEVEKRAFCNLKLQDITQTLNEQMYSWLVSGTVTYTNGFVISIQKIDVTDVRQTFSMRNVDGNGTMVPFGNIRGHLNFRDVKIGFDVIANLTNEGVHFYTGKFTHTTITLECVVEQNLETDVLTTNAGIASLSGGLHRIAYMPESNITEVLSRRYTPGDIYDGIGQIWGRDIIAPIMLDIVTNKLEFPTICFNC